MRGSADPPTAARVTAQITVSSSGVTRTLQGVGWGGAETLIQLLSLDVRMQPQSGPVAQWTTHLTVEDLEYSHSRSSNYADIAFLPSARHQKCPLLPFLYLHHEGRLAFPECVGISDGNYPYINSWQLHRCTQWWAQQKQTPASPH